MGPSRADLEALPRALGLAAVAAEIAGERAAADAALDAARRLLDLAPADRRLVGRRLRQPDGDVPGWPAASGEAAQRVLREGPREAAEAALGLLPADLAALLRDQDLDPLDLVTVHRRYGAVSGADIAAIAASADSAVPTRDPALLKLADRLDWLRGQRRRAPLGRAIGVLERCQQALAAIDEGIRVEALGSVRRFEPTVGDLDLLLVHPDPSAALACALAALEGAEVRHLGLTRAVLVVDRQEVGLRASTPEDAAALALWHTGAAAHVRALRLRARVMGLELHPHGLTDARGRQVPCASEHDLYAALRLPWIPPEHRHGEDEIERAAAGTLPSPVTVEDIRGDLHTHTLWSDGRDTVDAVARAARSLGYEYVAITDHSPGAVASRVLTLEKLDIQAADVARARAEWPSLAILHGVEVDILQDGSLDLPDQVLARLDIVLASLHEPHGHSPARLLERYARAMRHPLVNLVTHPSNRMPGRTVGYALDFDALFRMAVDTGTALEIDGGPAHLDLDGHLARRAVDAGVTLAIDSDGHDASRLGRQMRMGVGTARRGGVAAAHVLNTRPLPEVRAFFDEKRRRLA